MKLNGSLFLFPISGRLSVEAFLRFYGCGTSAKITIKLIKTLFF